MSFDYADEPYEAITVAISHIDAAIHALGNSERTDALSDMRNELNAERVALLGNGSDRPYYVHEMETKE